MLLEGFLRSLRQALTTSVKLCAGMSVAMPTAIPVPPFRRMLGSLAGSVHGSFRVPSKLGCQSTVPCPSSLRSTSAYRVRRDSVYRMAANDLGSSGAPQLPCPSTKG